MALEAHILLCPTAPIAYLLPNHRLSLMTLNWLRYISTSPFGHWTVIRTGGSRRADSAATLVTRPTPSASQPFCTTKSPIFTDNLQVLNLHRVPIVATGPLDPHRREGTALLEACRGRLLDHDANGVRRNLAAVNQAAAAFPNLNQITYLH